MRKVLLGCMAVLMIAGSVLADRKDEVTLVMVPREDSVIRVGMDLAARYPTLLVSYKLMPGGQVSLHGWTGGEWVNISSDAYKAGGFFRTGPDSGLIVEDESNPLPDALLPPEVWCTSAYKITTTEIRPLLHLAGQYYNFKYKDWQWFSENYNMSMEAINPEGLNVAWYHKRFGDNLKKKPVAADDLQFWQVIRHPDAKAEIIEPVESNTVDNVEETMVENPLTNDVPEAVVMDSVSAVEAEESPQELTE